MKHQIPIATTLTFFLLWIGGCSTTALPGIYSDPDSVFGGKSIQLSSNGNFTYYLWSDERGAECKIRGQWKAKGEKPTVVVTEVRTIEPAVFGNHCRNQPQKETWTIRSGSLIRLVEGKYEIRFRRVKGS